MNRQNVFAFFISAAITAAALTIIAYFWLNSGLKSVNVPAESVPYTASAYPESKNILFTFGDGYGVNFNLDFEHSTINALILDNPTEQEAEKNGYTVYKSVKSDYKFIKEITDIVGGITMDGEYTLTGVQLCAALQSQPDDYTLKRKVISQIFEKISKIGFSKDIILCIINSNETDLSYPDCYDFANYMDSMSKNVRLIN